MYYFHNIHFSAGTPRLIHFLVCSETIQTNHHTYMAGCCLLALDFSKHNNRNMTLTVSTAALIDEETMWEMQSKLKVILPETTPLLKRRACLFIRKTGTKPSKVMFLLEC